MSKDDGYILPEVVDPKETICIQLHIPKDRAHILAFMGQMWELTRWYNWQRDDAHTGKDVAAVWRKIYNEIKFGCAERPPTAGEYVDMPFFREVEDGGVCYLEFECCPGEWIRLARADQVPAGGQQGDGTPQPKPGGGTQQYCAKLNANGKYLIPTVVSTGDTITLDDASGAGNDGGTVLWFCPNGHQFFLNSCGPYTTTNSGDPLPATNHMQLIVNIDGVFYPLAIGSPVSVPSGVSNVQAFIQVNDSALSNNSGDYNICVTVKNNQALTWSHTIDFALSVSIFAAIPYAPAGSFGPTWVSATGWRGDNVLTSGIYDVLDSIEASWATATEIDAIEVFYDSTSDNGSNHGLREVTTDGSGYSTGTVYGALNTGSGSHDTALANVVTGVTSIQIYNDASNVGSGDTAHITKVIISGKGFDPFV